MSATTELLDYTGNPKHLPWCDRGDCYVSDEPDGHAAHYGHAMPPLVDANDAGEWRNAPEGQPEILVRPVELSGRAGVEVNAGDNRTRESTSGSIGLSWLTPTEARHLADLLVRAAEHAERARHSG